MNNASSDRAEALLKRVEVMRRARRNQPMGDWLDGYQAGLQEAAGGAQAVTDGRSRQFLAGVHAGRRDAGGGRA